MTHHLLLVDDDPTSRCLMAGLLVDMGYHVTSAAGGDEALNFLYSESACDLVLADVCMPGMSGIELARRTRDARPGMPVLFVTGRAEGIAQSLDAGVFAIRKPVSRDVLTRVIDDALSGSEH
jgi:CheY-like chemotaxis protein